MNIKEISRNKIFIYGAVGVGAYLVYRGVKKAFGFGTTAVVALQEQGVAEVAKGSRSGSERGLG